MKCNYHTHTKRCRHAKDVEDEAYVVQAITSGFAKLAFTDHIPFEQVPYPEVHQDRMSFSELDDYLDSIAELKERYKDQIIVYSGFEFEYFPAYLDHYRKLKAMTDVMIIGQHNRVPLIKDYAHGNNDEDVLVYAAQIRDCLDQELADIVAHPDYFMLGRNEWTPACTQAAETICAAAVRHDIPLELNLNGIRYGKKDYDGHQAYAYPYRAFWEIAARYGCKAIYGYDAHDPLTLSEAWRIDTVKAILSGIEIKMIDDIKIR